VDVFGLQKVKNPENFLTDNPNITDNLVDVAQSAFSKPGLPPAEETKEHVLPHSTLVLAYDSIEEEYVGFSSADEVAETVYESGIAVKEGLQGNGLGKAMLATTIGEQLEGETGTVTYRTQNPAMYDCSRDVFNAFPRQDNETPIEISQAMTAVAETLDPEEEFDRPVVREAYTAPMYSDLPNTASRPYLEEELEMDYENGDALIVAGEVTRNEIEQQVNQYVGENPSIETVREV